MAHAPHSKKLLDKGVRDLVRISDARKTPKFEDTLRRIIREELAAKLNAA